MTGGATARIVTTVIGLLAWALTAAICGPGSVARAQAPGEPGATPLELSPLEQSTDDFAREWRRVRRLLIACGVNDHLRQEISEIAETLIAQKLALRWSAGMQDSVSEDRRRVRPRLDRIPATDANCQAFGIATYEITSEYTSYIQAGVQPPLYRAPRAE